MNLYVKKCIVLQLIIALLLFSGCAIDRVMNMDKYRCTISDIHSVFEENKNLLLKSSLNCYNENKVEWLQISKENLERTLYNIELPAGHSSSVAFTILKQAPQENDLAKYNQLPITKESDISNSSSPFLVVKHQRYTELRIFCSDSKTYCRGIYLIDNELKIKKSLLPIKIILMPLALIADTGLVIVGVTAWTLTGFKAPEMAGI